MVMLEAEADDFRLVDFEREEAEEAEAAAAKLAAKRERAKVALGMLGSRFQRVDDAAGSPRTPHAAAAAPPLTSPRGEGADTWTKKSPRFFPDLDSGKLTTRPDLEKLARKRAQQLRFGGYSDKGAAIDAKIGGRIGGYSLLDDSAGLQAQRSMLKVAPPRWCHRPLPCLLGRTLQAPGELRHELGVTSCAAQGPNGGLRCGRAARPRPPMPQRVLPPRAR